MDNTCTREFKISSYATTEYSLFSIIFLNMMITNLGIDINPILYYSEALLRAECVTKSKASPKLINTVSVIYVAFIHSLINITFNLE